MGGSQSKGDHSFRANEWEQARDVEMPKQIQGHYVIVRNRITGQLLDRYTLQFPDERDYNKYLDSISYRRNEPNIVRVMHYQPKIVKQFCGSAYILNVYLEHCRSRLSEYEDIPFPDYLYCAMAMLEGYKKLYNKIGRFYVSEQQVMIDQDGEVRVWLNSDYSENQAEEFGNQNMGVGTSNDQEYEMVRDVMNMVFDNSDQTEGPGVKFVDYFERERNNLHQRVGFEQAKGITLDYMRVNNIDVLDTFRSVLELYMNDRNHDTMSFRNDVFNQEPSDAHMHRVGAAQPNTSQSNRNFGGPSSSGFHGESNIPSTFVNTIVSHLPSQPPAAVPIPQPQLQPQPQHQTVYIQQNRVAQPVQPVQHFVNRPVYPTPVARHHPVFQQFRPQPQPQQRQLIQQAPIQRTPRPQQSFPIVIRPAQAANNIPIVRNNVQQGRPMGPMASNQAQGQNQNLVQIQGQSQGQGQNQGQSQNNMQPMSILQQALTQKGGLFANQQGFQQGQQPQPQGLAGLMGNFLPNLPIQGMEKKSSIKEQGPLSKQSKGQPSGEEHIQHEDEHQHQHEYDDHDHDHDHQHGHEHEYGSDKSAEKKMLKQNTTQDVNEAKIIRDLSELHKIEEEQKSKRGDSSRNFNEYSERERKYNEFHAGDGEYEYHEEQGQGKGKGKGNMLAQDYNIEEMFHDDEGMNVKNSQMANKAQQRQQQYQQSAQHNQPNSPAYTVQPQQPQQPQRFPLRQISQPQYYSGFNPHQIPPFNSLQLNQFQSNQQQQINQANIIQNQINQMNRAAGSLTYQDSYPSSGSGYGVVGMGPGGAGAGGKRQIYYTLSSQVELDPEIAADMAMFGA